jgi:hypothetical protein
MVDRTGKRMQNTSMCHNMTARGGRSGWVGVGGQERTVYRIGKRM